MNYQWMRDMSNWGIGNAVQEIKPGDEISCSHAKLTDSAVLVHVNGAWVEFRPRQWSDMQTTVAEQNKLLAAAYAALLEARDTFNLVQSNTALASQRSTAATLPLTLAIDDIERWKQKGVKS